MDLVFVDLLAICAGLFGLIQSLTLLDQARILRRLGTAREVSMPFLVLAVLASATWLAYGTLAHNVALILVNLVAFVGATTTLATATRLRVDEVRAPAPRQSPESDFDEWEAALARTNLIPSA
jgi:uncharacterized protein with PQ loop repeat